MNKVSAKDVAAFMLNYLEKSHSLSQDTIVLLVHEKFGDDFICVNGNGNYSFKPNVLKAFRELTCDKVVWCRVSKYWRYRMDTDNPESRFADE